MLSRVRSRREGETERMALSLLPGPLLYIYVFYVLDSPDSFFKSGARAGESPARREVREQLL